MFTRSLCLSASTRVWQAIWNSQPRTSFFVKNFYFSEYNFTSATSSHFSIFYYNLLPQSDFNYCPVILHLTQHASQAKMTWAKEASRLSGVGFGLSAPLLSPSLIQLQSFVLSGLRSAVGVYEAVIDQQYAANSSTDAQQRIAKPIFEREH